MNMFLRHLHELSGYRFDALGSGVQTVAQEGLRPKGT